MHSIAAAACTLVVCLGSEADRPPAGQEPSEVKVEVEGAMLSYVARDIPRAKRSPRGEMEWIQKARATIHVGKPIGFRRARLPAGEYRIRVEVEDGTSHYLVIEPVKGEGEEGETEEKGEAGKPKEARRKGGEETAFTLERKEEKEEPAPGTPPAKEPRGRSGQGKRKEAGPGTGGPATAPDGAEEGLRVPLSIAPTEKTSDAISFGLKLASRGSKLRITVRAGTTEARASLRFGTD